MSSTNEHLDAAEEGATTPEPLPDPAMQQPATSATPQAARNSGTTEHAHIVRRMNVYSGENTSIRYDQQIEYSEGMLHAVGSLHEGNQYSGKGQTIADVCRSSPAPKKSEGM